MRSYMVWCIVFVIILFLIAGGAYLMSRLASR
jgi:hypothetical protein